MLTRVVNWWRSNPWHGVHANPAGDDRRIVAVYRDYRAAQSFVESRIDPNQYYPSPPFQIEPFSKQELLDRGWDGTEGFCDLPSLPIEAIVTRLSPQTYYWEM